MDTLNACLAVLLQYLDFVVGNHWKEKVSIQLNTTLASDKLK